MILQLGIEKFGKSAPYKEIYEEMNLTSNKIASIIQKKIEKIIKRKFMEKIKVLVMKLILKTKE